MKIKQEINLLAWVHKSKKRASTGRAPLFVRLTIEGMSTEISLKAGVLPGAWNEAEKTVNSTDPRHKEINKKILAAQVDLPRIYDKLWHEHEKVTPAMVKRVYQGYEAKIEINGGTTENSVGTILDAFDQYIERFEQMVQKDLRSPGTLRHWRSTKKKVQIFIQARYKRNDLELHEIRPSFAEEMYDFHTIKATSPLDDATIKKHIKKTKQILKGCATQQLISANPIENYKCGGDVKEVEPLEYHQVLHIYNKDFGTDRLNRIRDAFIFQCFTGFAYQDIAGLKRENIILYGKKAERWLVKERGKTKVTEMVPVLPVIDELLLKYEKDPYCRMSGKLIPIISNSKYNGYLKEIAVICGIDRNLNTHLARHTFADIMLNSGIPLEDVSKMLGHKSIRTTQRYCRVRKERISTNMAIIRTTLFSKKGKLKGIKSH